MKLTKILMSLTGAAFFAFAFSACSATASNNAAANNINKPNAAIVTTNQTIAANNAAPVSSVKPSPGANKTAATPAADTSEDATTIEGELQKGKTESVILYVGMESGDYAAYCFPNDSEAGRAILAACKDKQQCEVSGEVESGGCKVPGLEADLSDSGRIVKVVSAKPTSRKK